MANITKTIPWGNVGYLTFKRTYARPIEQRTEEWEETIERVIRSCNDQLHMNLNLLEKEEIKDMMMSLKGTVAGRFLWQLGTSTVDRIGMSSLMNCCFTVIDEPIKPFTWTFEMLMLGSGVGFSVQRKYIKKLPVIKKKVDIVKLDTNDADFIVPDSREGWVQLLKKTLEASFITGKSFTYATHLIRPKGSLIKGFGGIASGPDDLVWGIGEINKILNSKVGGKITSVDALDIMNIIGQIVISGNVRRSAQIALGDYDDIDFLKAKRWDLGSIPNWRAMSNNSVVCDDTTKLPIEFWEGYQGNGECYGLINIKAAKRMGRVGETQYPDKKVKGFNPSLRGGTKVWTTEGVVSIEELQDKEFYVRNLHGNIEKAKCWLSKPKAQLYKITLKGGHEYYCTPEHKWVIYTPQGYVKVETPDLKKGHLFPITKHEKLSDGIKGDYSDGFFIGWLYGDGGIHIRKDNGKPQGNLIVSAKDDESNISSILLDKLNSLKPQESFWLERKGNKELNFCSKSVFNWLDEFGVDYECKKLPSEIWNNCSENFRKGFIDGLFSSDGGVESTYKSSKIRISSSKKELITNLSEFLGFYGIKNSIHTTKTTLNEKEFQRWDLTIASRENISFFRKLFHFTVKHKQENLDSISVLKAKPRSGSLYEVISLELTDIEEPVWDINVMDDTHCFQIAHVITGNCSEQPLADNEVCCLAEMFLPNIESYDEFLKIMKMLYRINKHALLLPSHSKRTEKIVHKNMRMGIGVTGYLQASEEQRAWLKHAYKELREFDKEYSDERGIPRSIKLTTVKPSGSLSLLAGVTPGAHPAYSQYYIRRIRIAANSPLIDVCKDHGYDVEPQYRFDGTTDNSTLVVSFPTKVPDNTRLAKEMTAIDQLEVIKRLQTEWSDNAVSVTIYYRKHELEDIKLWLKNNYKDVKSVSFLLHNDHGFTQAPYEEISKEQFESMIQKTKPIDSLKSVNFDDVNIEECQGACPLR